MQNACLSKHDSFARFREQVTGRFTGWRDGLEVLLACIHCQYMLIIKALYDADIFAFLRGALMAPQSVTHSSW